MTQHYEKIIKFLPLLHALKYLQMTPPPYATATSLLLYRFGDFNKDSCSAVRTLLTLDSKLHCGRFDDAARREECSPCNIIHPA